MLKNTHDNTQIPSIIACDIGLKRIGLATLTQGIILPLAPIHRRNRNQASNELSLILKNHNANILVVGLPSGGEAQNTDMQKRIRHFVSLVDFDGEVCYIDEDMSSVIALESLSYLRRDSKAKATKDGRVDSLSACEILKRYLESKP